MKSKNVLVCALHCIGKNKLRILCFRKKCLHKLINSTIIELRPSLELPFMQLGFTTMFSSTIHQTMYVQKFKRDFLI